jgi:hypothetical protein
MEEFQRNGVHINEDFEFALKISFLLFSSKVEKKLHFYETIYHSGGTGPISTEIHFSFVLKI